MKSYINEYDYVIYLNYYEDKYFISLLRTLNTKQKYIITVRIPKLL